MSDGGRRRDKAVAPSSTLAKREGVAPELAIFQNTLEAFTHRVQEADKAYKVSSLLYRRPKR